MILRALNGALRVENTVGAAIVHLFVNQSTLQQNWWLRTQGSDGAFAVYNQTGSRTPFSIARGATNNLMRLAGSNVGINTALPRARLHVTGTSWFQGDSTPLPAEAGAGIAVGYASALNAGYIFGFDYGASAPRNLLLNHPGGNVGIGTVAPIAKLHVAGGTGTGLYATSSSSVALYGASTNSSALYGISTNSSALYGSSSSGYGVEGRSSSQIGVYGQSGAASSAGMYGVSPYIGVQGVASGTDVNRQALRGDNSGSSTGYAGFFHGNVWVFGTLTKNAGAFRIDHPLDPANKYLNHSFVESPDMMNIYNGNVELDRRGEAVIVLPEWFEALNKDFRYQLTAIGAPGPNLYVAEKITGNRFKIAGGAPGMEVSWQVTGIRHDPYAEQHRIVVEEMKPVRDRGRYLLPEAFGQPKERGVEVLRPAPVSPGRPEPGRLEDQ